MGKADSVPKSDKRHWLPRLFILLIAPSVAMIFALIFYPESDIAKCPLFVESGDRSDELAPGQPFFNINGAIFGINNYRIFPGPIVGNPGDQIVFVGIVLDVRSAANFYSSGQGYSALASGKDSTRALLTSSLEPQDMVADISDLAKGELKPKIIQWISFFLNKYKQLGVVAGPYWTSSGKPTPLLLQYMELIAPSERYPDRPAPEPHIEEPCVLDNQEVTCRHSKLHPKIKRSRGKSECICAEENEIFGIKTEDFVVIHFNNCTDQSARCTVDPLELD